MCVCVDVCMFDMAQRYAKYSEAMDKSRELLAQVLMYVCMCISIYCKQICMYVCMYLGSS